jgi:hypothetical protein
MRRDDIIEILPANPPVAGYGSQAYREAIAANQDLSVRGRSAAPVVIPPPPKAEQVPVPPPAERRNFGPAPAGYAQNRTRRED